MSGPCVLGPLDCFDIPRLGSPSDETWIPFPTCVIHDEFFPMRLALAILLHVHIVYLSLSLLSFSCYYVQYPSLFSVLQYIFLHRCLGYVITFLGLKFSTLSPRMHMVRQTHRSLEASKCSPHSDLPRGSFWSISVIVAESCYP